MKKATSILVIGIMLVTCCSVVQAAKSNSEFKMAYPENNYDLTYSPIIHADIMTYNMTVPVWNLFNSRGISVSQTYFLNKSRTMAYDSETLVEYPQLRNYAISHQNVNGIYTHAMRMNTALTTSQTLASLILWKQLIGSFPLIWIDHGGMPQNIDRYGSQPSSSYYIGGLRNSTSLKYAWVNYDDSGRIIPLMPNYDLTVRNSLLGFSNGNYGLVYKNSGNTNLFTSGMRILYPEFYVPYDYFVKPIANARGLTLEHTYMHYYVYKNIDGVKYTRSIPKPSGYNSWPSTWNLHYMDATNPWLIMPEYVTSLNDILSHYTINSGLGHLLIDRGIIYNDSSVYKISNTIYLNTPSLMNNVTIYAQTNQSGKALSRDGNYYIFTKGYNSWGATIPSNIGNKSYSIVTWSHKVVDNGQIGKLVYNNDGSVNIHFKRTGSVTIWVENPSVEIVNLTTGQDVSYYFYSGNNITFNGTAGCQYSITEQSQYVSLNINSLPESLRLLIIQEFIRQLGAGDYTLSEISGLKL